MTKALVVRLVREDSGQDVIEYGLLIGIIAAASVMVIKALAGIVANFYISFQTNAS